MNSEFVEYVKRGDKIYTGLINKYPELKSFLSDGYPHPSCWSFSKKKINKLMGGNFILADVMITADIINILLNKLHNKRRLTFEF